MEYFIGSITTFILMFLTTQMVKTRYVGKRSNPFRYSQSHIYSIVKPLLPTHDIFKKRITTQSSLHEERTNIKVIILENKAYFIRDGAFYVADIDGVDIDRESAKIVDTISMDKVQLDKMLFIMDKLRDGKTDDSGGPRN
jgi:hypothetical protein